MAEINPNEIIFRTIIEDLNSGIAIFESSRLIYANPYFKNITRYFNDGSKNKKLNDFFDSSSFPDLSTNINAEFETSLTCRNNEIKTVNVKAFFSKISPSENKWLIIILRDIEDHKELIASLRNSRKYLKKKIEEKSDQLEHVNLKLTSRSKYIDGINSALKILLENREKEIAEFSHSQWASLNCKVMPYINSLKKTTLSKTQMETLNIIENSLLEIFSDNFPNTIEIQFNLTPSESNIANLVKLGKTTKEIANICKISPRTVERHRDNIRKKTGIQGKKISLRSFLLSKNTQHK